MMLSYNEKHKRMISTLLICIIIVSGMIPYKITKADDPWVSIDDSYYNDSQKTRVDGDTIVQTGTHNSADDDAIRYRTLYFRMTRSTYITGEKFTEGANADIEYAYVPFEFGTPKVNGTTIIHLYKLYY